MNYKIIILSCFCLLGMGLSAVHSASKAPDDLEAITPVVTDDSGLETEPVTTPTVTPTFPPLDKHALPPTPTRTQTPTRTFTSTKTQTLTSTPTLTATPRGTRTPVMKPEDKLPRITVIPNPARGDKAIFRVLTLGNCSARIKVYNRFFDTVANLEGEGDHLFDIIWSLKNVPEGPYSFQAQITNKDSGQFTTIPLQKFTVEKDEVLPDN